MIPEPKKILLADDDLDDLELLEEAFLSINPSLQICAVSSGTQGIEFLKNCDDSKLPCLIILDYNMPDFTGPEVLEKILKLDKYKGIPCVIWSTSNTNLYKEISLKKGAQKYYEKPQSYKAIIALANDMLAICS